eukprot:1193142-Prorocentrum_minimum.AAC.1
MSGRRARGTNRVTRKGIFRGGGANRARRGRCIPRAGAKRARRGRRIPRTGANRARRGRCIPRTGANHPRRGRCIPRTGANRARRGRRIPRTGANRARRGKYIPTGRRCRPRMCPLRKTSAVPAECSSVPITMPSCSTPSVYASLASGTCGVQYSASVRYSREARESAVAGAAPPKRAWN